MAKRSDAIISLGVIFGALLLSAVLIFKIGKFQIGTTHRVRVLFNFVNGLDASAPVRYGGALVGKVDSVEVLTADQRKEFGQDKNILVVADLSQPVDLTEGTEVTVNTMGFVGEKYIEIRPGPVGSPPLKSNLLVGTDPAQMEKLLHSGQKALDELLVSAQHLNSLTAELDKRIPGTTDKMDRAFTTMSRSFDRMDDSMEILHRALGTIGAPQTQENIRQTLANLRVLSVYGKIFTSTVAQKPWRVIWGGKPTHIPSELEILTGQSAAAPKPNHSLSSHSGAAPQTVAPGIPGQAVSPPAGVQSIVPNAQSPSSVPATEANPSRGPRSGDDLIPPGEPAEYPEAQAAEPPSSPFPSKGKF